MEDRGLSADALGIYRGMGIDVGPVTQQQINSVHISIFGGDVQQRGAGQREHPATRGAEVEFAESSIDERRVSVELRSHQIEPAAQQFQHAWHGVSRPGAGCDQHVDARREIR